MKFFDYIFYRVHNAYSKKDDTPWVYASAVVSLLQLGFVVAALSLFTLFTDIETLDKESVLPVILVVLALNWYRYERNLDISTFEKLWRDEPKPVRRRNGYLCLFHLKSIPVFQFKSIPFMVNN
ncbi:MAG: hypothetical protein RH948_19075 [Cyclobacteriaceae bacterium]